MENKHTGGLFQRLVLMAMIVIVPGASWYFLYNGMQYRKRSLSELGDFGVVAPFVAKPINAKAISNDSLFNRVTVATFILNKNNADEQLMLQNQGKLYSQFQERKDVYFLTFIEADSSATYDIAKKGSLLKSRSYVIACGSEEVKIYLNDFKVSELSKPYLKFVFLDPSTKIRKMYEANDPEVMKRMVEHLAMKLPLEKILKPEVKH